jgi:IS30 family transposase
LGTDLSVLSQADLDTMALHRNAKPRESLGWKAPAELRLSSGSFDF